MTASPAYGWARAARTVVLGGSSLGLAAIAHLAGGGELPSATVLGAVGLVVGLMAVTLTARRCRVPVLLAVLGAQQVVLHQVFNTSAAVASACGTGVPAHHAMGTGCWSTSMSSMEPTGWSMLAGHVAATLITACVLARGEAWWWRVLDQVSRAANAALARRPRTASRLRVDRPIGRPTTRAYAPAVARGPPVR